MTTQSNSEETQALSNQVDTLLLEAYNCADCWSLNKHSTGAYVTCPHCHYEDDTNLGSNYDYLYGGEFLDSYCRNCGVRLQATYRISTAWITHQIYGEIANKYRHEAYLKGRFWPGYEEQVSDMLTDSSKPSIGHSEAPNMPSTTKALGGD